MSNEIKTKYNIEDLDIISLINSGEIDIKSIEQIYLNKTWVESIIVTSKNKNSFKTEEWAIVMLANPSYRKSLAYHTNKVTSWEYEIISPEIRKLIDENKVNIKTIESMFLESLK